EGVSLLLGQGRKDDSGDYTEGAGLDTTAINTIINFLQGKQDTRSATLNVLRNLIGTDRLGREGVEELREIDELLQAAGFNEDRVVIDPSVVRGLEYYTGPVLEAELTFDVKNEQGQTLRFGSVGGGGRYDDLVARFTGQKIPSTGFSFGVSRLQTALLMRGYHNEHCTLGPVIVLVMNHGELSRYQQIVQQLRAAGIRSEMYIGTSGMKAQMKYADKRGAPCVIIQGDIERATGKIQIKDLIEGARMAEEVTEFKDWRELRPAQFSISENELVAAVKNVIARYEANPSLRSRSNRDVG
ncbi:MAG: ATP phosphoribosyltransferase regulatory subunit, partial [Hyphomicrobiaceae bacterium]|nr:ATP phosphoribosyltransferase regulatory subunit [Hyphomicrobiaceae bacterium]